MFCGCFHPVASFGCTTALFQSIFRISMSPYDLVKRPRALLQWCSLLLGSTARYCVAADPSTAARDCVANKMLREICTLLKRENDHTNNDGLSAAAVHPLKTNLWTCPAPPIVTFAHPDKCLRILHSTITIDDHMDKSLQGRGANQGCVN